MELIYLVIIFVLIMLDIAVLLVGGWLLPMVFGFFSLTIMGFALDQSANIPFSPYLQLLLGLVGVICFLKAVIVYRSG